MATQVAPITLAEFHAMPETPGVKRELIDGVILEDRSMARKRHERVKGTFNEVFTAYTFNHDKWFTCPETEFDFNGQSAIPDVAIVSREAFYAGEPEGRYSIAPILAIEVVSSETAADLRRKIRGYLEAGSLAVIVAFPETREVEVWRPAGVQVLRIGDTLELPEIGFQVSVAKLFKGV